MTDPATGKKITKAQALAIIERLERHAKRASAIDQQLADTAGQVLARRKQELGMFVVERQHAATATEGNAE